MMEEEITRAAKKKKTTTTAKKKKTTSTAKKKTTTAKKKTTSTGVRLSAAEKKLIANYRKCNIIEKKLLDLFAEKAAGGEAKTLDISRFMDAGNE